MNESSPDDLSYVEDDSAPNNDDFRDVAENVYKRLDKTSGEIVDNEFERTKKIASSDKKFAISDTSEKVVNQLYDQLE